MTPSPQRTTPPRSAFAAALALALAFALAACGHDEHAEDEARPVVKGESVVFPKGSPSLARIAVEKVAEPVATDRVIPGRLGWDEERTVRVFTPFGGRVTRLIARPGDRVAAGAPLAEMRSPEFDQAQADARRAAADLELASKAVERLRDLHANGVAAAKDLHQAEADFARAKAESERALGRLATYGQDLGSDRFVLRSPMAGVVVERNLNPGQELRSDQPGVPLFVVTDPTHLWVTLDANEADIQLFRPGMLIVLSSTQFPEESFAAELAQVADFVDPTSRTVKVRGVVPNPDRRLKAEMFVNGRLTVPKGSAPTVSAKAVYLNGSRRFVFVRTDPVTFVRRGVRVGAETDGRVPVLAGLEIGDEVAVTGNLFLQQILSLAPVSEAAPEKDAAKKP